MGVPTLFRWLTTKYPKITRPVIEDLPPADMQEDEYFKTFDFNASEHSPTGVVVDNLYLDLNGIVHPCCHPEGRPAPPNEQAMMHEIHCYIDRIMSMVRPKKLLYMAIDGVAPRAKMNQQRSRRFRTALESKKHLPQADNADHEEGKAAEFDSNCITPGTPFMDTLRKSLLEYVQHRIECNKGWRNLYVIISDSAVPGEGEHKIMDFIRRQRESPSYHPNQTHVIYGLDADLIMLALATHEPRFLILREDVFFEESRRYNTCFLCNNRGHFSDDCPKASVVDAIPIRKSIVTEKPFIFLDIAILREYLQLDFFTDRGTLPVESNFERLIDDWVFMSFFVGNDFLPHLPSMDIREGAIDAMMKIYKTNFMKMGGYITKNGHVYLDRMQVMFEELGKGEDEVFVKRKETHERKETFRKRREKEEMRNKQEKEELRKREEEAENASKRLCSIQEQVDASINADNEESGKVQVEPEESVLPSLLPLPTANATTSSISLNSTDSAFDDDVRFWEPGAKERYYQRKLNISPSTNSQCVQEIVKSYVEGLCWVLAYYYQGCVSWKWFYPFHYAPLASDFTSIANLTVSFEHSSPFRAFEQLMSVLPSASCSLIPQAFHWLMTDKNSEIADFYPNDFPIDLNGKKFAWQGVALLPFIDEQRLLESVEKVMPMLEPCELLRNEVGVDLLFMSHDLSRRVIKDGEFLLEISELDGQLSPLSSLDTLYTRHISEIMSGNCACFVYKNVAIEKAGHVFVARLLPDAKLPERVLVSSDADFGNKSEYRDSQSHRQYDRARAKQY